MSETCTQDSTKKLQKPKSKQTWSRNLGSRIKKLLTTKTIQISDWNHYTWNWNCEWKTIISMCNKKFNTRTKGENQLNFEFLCVSESLTHTNNNKNQ